LKIRRCRAERQHGRGCECHAGNVARCAVFRKRLNE
jgi:hypothetical protein